VPAGGLSLLPPFTGFGVPPSWSLLSARFCLDVAAAAAGASHRRVYWLAKTSWRLLLLPLQLSHATRRALANMLVSWSRTVETEVTVDVYGVQAQPPSDALQCTPRHSSSTGPSSSAKTARAWIFNPLNSTRT